MAGLERPDRGEVAIDGVDARNLERGRARAVPRRAHRHRLPVLPSDPDHDGARERRGAARTRRRAPTRCRAPGPNSTWSASPTGSAIIRPSFPAASSSAWRSPARSAPQPSLADRRRADRQSRRGDGRGDHGPAVRLCRAGAARRSCSSPTIRRSPRAATGWSACARARSRTRRRRRVSGMNAPAGFAAATAEPPADRALRLARPARRASAGLRIFLALHRARRGGDRRRREPGAALERRPRRAGAGHPRRRRLVLADPSPPLRRTSGRFSSAAARSRPSRPCGRWPRTGAATRPWSRSRRSSRLAVDRRGDLRSADVDRRSALAEKDGAFGAAAEETLLARLDLKVGDAFRIGDAQIRPARGARQRAGPARRSASASGRACSSRRRR